MFLEASDDIFLTDFRSLQIGDFLDLAVALQVLLDELITLNQISHFRK